MNILPDFSNILLNGENHSVLFEITRDLTDISNKSPDNFDIVLLNNNINSYSFVMDVQNYLMSCYNYLKT